MIAKALPSVPTSWMTYFDCQFEELFEVMAIDLEPEEDQIG